MAPPDRSAVANAQGPGKVRPSAIWADVARSRLEGSAPRTRGTFSADWRPQGSTVVAWCALSADCLVRLSKGGLVHADAAGLAGVEGASSGGAAPRACRALLAVMELGRPGLAVPGPRRAPDAAQPAGGSPGWAPRAGGASTAGGLTRGAALRVVRARGALRALVGGRDAGRAAPSARRAVLALPLGVSSRRGAPFAGRAGLADTRRRCSHACAKGAGRTGRALARLAQARLVTPATARAVHARTGRGCALLRAPFARWALLARAVVNGTGGTTPCAGGASPAGARGPVVPRPRSALHADRAPARAAVAERADGVCGAKTEQQEEG
mmetsp:Transcript_19106/g.51991  ORF Transcript_19106/g.51991 Transcript_19106/m.51991 type:complete len:326 (-) Transcript_19106:98-1075(-)